MRRAGRRAAAYALGPGYLTDAKHAVRQHDGRRTLPTTVFTLNAGGAREVRHRSTRWEWVTQTGPTRRRMPRLSNLGQLLTTFEEQVGKSQVESVQVYQPEPATAVPHR